MRKISIALAFMLLSVLPVVAEKAVVSPYLKRAQALGRPGTIISEAVACRNATNQSMLNARRGHWDYPQALHVHTVLTKQCLVLKAGMKIQIMPPDMAIGHNLPYYEIVWPNYLDNYINLDYLYVNRDQVSLQ